MDKDIEKYNEESQELIKKQRKAFDKLKECYSKVDNYYKTQIEPQNNMFLNKEQELEYLRLCEEYKNAIKELNEIIDEYQEFIKRGY